MSIWKTQSAAVELRSQNMIFAGCDAEVDIYEDGLRNAQPANMRLTLYKFVPGVIELRAGITDEWIVTRKVTSVYVKGSKVVVDCFVCGSCRIESWIDTIGFVRRTVEIW
jgi:hypothetical protein